jgi:hypothetical protein
MRGEYDLHQSKYDAEGEHLEFKHHCCHHADCEEDTIASPGTIGPTATWGDTTDDPVRADNRSFYKH